MKRLTLVTMAAALVLTACGGDPDVASAGTASSDQSSSFPSSSPSQASSSASKSPSANKQTGTVIKSADSQFGSVLFDRRGQAIYLFDKEKGDKPACYGACADAWPPVLTKGSPVPPVTCSRGCSESLIALTAPSR